LPSRREGTVVRHCGLQKVGRGVRSGAMPLIPNRSGGLALVCINGCEVPATTKGLSEVVEQANANKTAAEHLNRGALNVIPLTGIPTTMGAVEGPRAVVTVTYPDAGVPLKGGGGRELRTIEEFLRHRRAVLDPSSGTTLLLYVCSVCGYTEMYHADIVDRANAPMGG